MKNTLRVGAFLLLFSIASFAQSEQCADVSEQAHVSAVYPTADTLPENLLRFYIYFDQPMSTEDTLSNIYLKTNGGERLEGVFLDNKFSLWSPDRTRLTLLFDPGRVKTGLVAHNALGRALKTGLTYRLVVDVGAMKQLNCSAVYIKEFSVEEANYDKPMITNWRINQPKYGTRQPLTIGFERPIDHTSLAFRIRVRNSNNETVSGSIDLGSHEKKWIFVPELNWAKDQTYALFIDPILEDIVGNRITGLFDQPSLIEDSINKDKNIEVGIAFTN
ncbi:hypothetical protein AB2S62_19320 [Vibrio sp. NTOU-M3]|uniref:hypothetical protein n=1 Tax=Vibrio sp. NTOU-M3 TaxID=3234954 RepID=UPI00349F874E